MRDGMPNLVEKFREKEEGQDVAEYAVLLAVSTIRLIGSTASGVLASVGSAIR
jgi:Flp pilus assembly pilin Flp